MHEDGEWRRLTITLVEYDLRQKNEIERINENLTSNQRKKRIKIFNFFPELYKIDTTK